MDEEMKHIKEYKIFESNESDFEIESTLKEIFLELSDVGFQVEISKDQNTIFDRFRVSIIFVPVTMSRPFKVSDIKDCVQRSCDYMSLNKYYLDDIDAQGPTFKNFKKVDISIDLNSSTWDTSEILYINLYFVG